MAAGNKSGSGDMVLGGRHLIGIFVLLVVLFGVVFTLGYVLGRNQDMQVHAAAGTVAAVPAKAPEKSEATTDDKSPDIAVTPPLTDAFDFYHSAEPAKTPEVALTPPTSEAGNAPPGKNLMAKAPAKIPTPVPFVPAAGTQPPPEAIAKSLRAPEIPNGATVWQVAAMGRQTDATAMAQALQQKKFPAFVLVGTADKFFHVQVGPYTDAKTALDARQKLENQGFKELIKVKH